LAIAAQAISTQQTFVRSQSVVARVVAGETLIVPIRAKVGDLASIYSFNGTASLIWKLLDAPRTVAELAMAVAEEYEVDLAQAESDVTDFVGEMKAVGLVDIPASVAMTGD
jgi:Coenzyme PQQ synthesis protein D (PqqD)